MFAMQNDTGGFLYQLHIEDNPREGWSPNLTLTGIVLQRAGNFHHN